MCNTTFGRISALNKHLKKKVCEKKKEKNNLNNYNCVFCGRSFSRKDNKRSHEKNCIPEIEKNENLVFMEKQPTLKFIRVAKDLPWTGKKLENPILIHLWEEFEEYMKRTKIVGCDLLKEHQRSDLKTSSIIDFKGRLKTFFKWLEMEKEEIYHEIQVVKTLLNHKIVLEFRHAVLIDHNQTYSNSANYIQSILRFVANLWSDTKYKKKFLHIKVEELKNSYESLYSFWMAERGRAKKEQKMRNSREVLEKHGLFKDWEDIIEIMEKKKVWVRRLLEKQSSKERVKKFPPNKNELKELRQWLVTSLYVYIPPKRSQLANPYLMDKFPDDFSIGTEKVMLVMVYDEKTETYSMKSYNTKGEHTLDSNRLSSLSNAKGIIYLIQIICRPH